jgi:DNA mismatch repair protein MutS
LLAALEKHGGPLGTGAPLGALPLFAAAPPSEPEPEMTETEALRRALSEIDPDTLSPRGALDALYRLKAMLTVCAGQPT